MKFLTKTAQDAAAKLAFSVTPEGHEMDAAHYRSIADYLDKAQDYNDDYAKRAKIRSLLAGDRVSNILMELQKRHYAHASRLHENEENAYNPVGGLMTPYHRKHAFALTPEGHDYDARLHRAAADMFGDIQDATDKYRRKAKLRGLLLQDPGMDLQGELLRRHFLYTAKKHEKGENAYNPFGGMSGSEDE